MVRTRLTAVVISAVLIMTVLTGCSGNPDERSKNRSTSFAASSNNITDNPVTSSVTDPSETLDSSDNTSHSSTDSNAAPYQEGAVYLYDEAALFSEEEYSKIKAMLRDTAEKTGFNLALYVGGQSRNDESIENLAQTGALNLFDSEEQNNTVFLYIDFDGLKNAYDYLFASNDAYLYYTNGSEGTEDRINDILNSMQAHFPSGGETPDNNEVINGLQVYCDRLIQYKEKGPVEGSSYIDEKTGETVYALGGKIIHGN